MFKVSKAAVVGGVVFGLLAAGTANAQSTPPNLGNYEALADLFRVGLTITNGAGSFSDSYGLDDADEANDFLSDSFLRARYGSRYTGTEAVQAVLDFRGVPMIGSYDAGSTTFRLRVPAFDEPGRPYLLTFTGPTRNASYQAFQDYFDEIDSAEAERLIRLLLAALARTSPVDPIAGNPDSLQTALVRAGLDLAEGDSAIEGGAESAAADPWMVGVAYSNSSAGRFSTDRFDARFQRSFRVLEGSRALLKIELPVNYSDVNGARSARVGLGAGLEIPVIENRWSLEPRIGYGLTASDQLGSLGHMLSGSVTSRYKIDGVGRGHLIIGNMVGYTTSLSTAFTDYNIDPNVKNWVFRNGLAYELPLSQQFFGRGGSVRASYTYTNFTGDELFLEKFHEVTVSVGVRNREGVARNTSDLIRINLSGTFGDNYDSVSVGAGFRF